VFITHDLDEALRLGDHIAILRDGEVVQQGTGQDIVINPADDYIASFVREVNRARVINVETIAAFANNPTIVPKVSVSTGTKLEDAARAMTLAGESEIAVVDPSGHPIGILTLERAVEAMVTANTSQRQVRQDRGRVSCL
jgi:glycine betaine/proline transport system ATP-binding protein